VRANTVPLEQTARTIAKHLTALADELASHRSAAKEDQQLRNEAQREANQVFLNSMNLRTN
jgi:hypothetical protein